MAIKKTNGNQENQWKSRKCVCVSEVMKTIKRMGHVSIVLVSESV